MPITGIRESGLAPNYAQDSVRIRQRQYQQRSASEGKLEITTAEGDKVTLSFSQAAERSRARGAVEGSDTGVTRTQATAQSSQVQLSVSVEGDLSKQELEDIGKLVNALSRATRSIQSGDIEKASRAISRANQLGSISQYSYAYQASAETSFQESRLDVLG
jgi:hypothetical protein